MAAQPPRVRILFYAINGVGLGHLSRLLTLARQARELLRVLGAKAEFSFVTTSEAPEIAFDFPTYKLPSKNVIAHSDFNNRQYLAQSKHFVANLTAAFQPDLLVVDTQPEGAFAEIQFLQAYAKACVFVYRQKQAHLTETPEHQQALKSYTQILIPDHPAQAEHYPLPEALWEQTRFIGRVHGYQAGEALGPEAVRQYFNLPVGKKLIYLSAGGGTSLEDLNCLIAALREVPDYVLLVGYGPLYHGPRVYADNVIPLSEPAISRYFAGVHAAVSAAGYNSYEEILAAGLPALFFAQERGMDLQDQRILAGYQAGWHLVFDPLEPFVKLSELPPEQIRQSVARLFEPDTRARLQANLAQRPVEQGALNGALALLELHAHLPGSRLDVRELQALALTRWLFPAVSGANWRAAQNWLRLWQSLSLSPYALAAEQQQAASLWLQRQQQHPPELAAAAEAQRERFALALCWEQQRQALDLSAALWSRLLKKAAAVVTEKTPAQSRLWANRLRSSLQMLTESSSPFQSSQASELLQLLLEKLRGPALLESLHFLLADFESQPQRDPQAVLTCLRAAPSGLAFVQFRQLWLAACSEALPLNKLEPD